MKLSDIYDQLAYGELRQVVLGTGPLTDLSDSGVPKSSYPKLFPLVKAGLTEIYKQFPLREDEVNVTVVDGTTLYTVSATNCMRIERIYGTYLSEEYEIPLNKVGDDEAVKTTMLNTFTIPTDTEKAPWLLETTTLRVVYRADHPAINEAKANSAPSIVDIELPAVFLEAIGFYIASRSLNANGVVSEMHEGNNYRAQFNTALQVLKDEGYDSERHDESSKLADRGWP